MYAVGIHAIDIHGLVPIGRQCLFGLQLSRSKETEHVILQIQRILQVDCE